jgi:UDP-galactopyranose mutase
LINNKFDFLVVGCGLSGSVIARYLAENCNKKVLIWERRNHIGGNMYDYKDEHGILVHKYGPHAFHTTKKYLFNYVSNFSSWKPYNLTTMAYMNGKFTPTPFNFKTIEDYYSIKDAKILKKELLLEYPNKETVDIIELLNQKNKIIKEFAEFLFENDYKPYAAKQWDIPIEKIDVSVLKRVPIRLSYKLGYFDDEYQALPKDGYTEFFRDLLDHPNIEIELEIDDLKRLAIDFSNNVCLIGGMKTEVGIIYTGALDELFKGKEGFLPYRSLKFEHKYKEIESFQDAPIVAYPQEKYFTRITEYKKLPVQNVFGTSYVIEYPLPYKANEKNEPYYPVLTEESQKLYEYYKRKAEKIKNFYYCGRLADFKYYNMDETLERALEVCKKIKL